MNRQIDRLLAEQDLRQVQLLGSATSQEGYGRIVERLQRQMGQIVVYEPSIKMLNLDDDELDPEFDREGLHALMGKAPPRPKEAVTT